MAMAPVLAVAGFFASTPQRPVGGLEHEEVLGAQNAFLERQQAFRSCRPPSDL